MTTCTRSSWCEERKLAVQHDSNTDRSYSICHIALSVWLRPMQSGWTPRLSTTGISTTTTLASRPWSAPTSFASTARWWSARSTCSCAWLLGFMAQTSRPVRFAMHQGDGLDTDVAVGGSLLLQPCCTLHRVVQPPPCFPCSFHHLTPLTHAITQYQSSCLQPWRPITCFRSGGSPTLPPRCSMRARHARSSRRAS